MSGIRTQMMEAIHTKLSQLTWAKYVEWENIKLMAGDFADHDVPAIQFYVANTSYTHQGGRVEATSDLYIELVMMQTDQAIVKPQDLMDKMEEIELKIGEQPNLGIPGMVHLRYLGDDIDMHTIAPYYYGRLSFQAIYHKKYSGC
jgi:hypothetical protein